jgi:transposase-like protein
MEGRQRRSFTDDYKRQAVDLVASSGRSIGSVAKELGLRDSSESGTRSIEEPRPGRLGRSVTCRFLVVWRTLRARVAFRA